MYPGSLRVLRELLDDADRDLAVEGLVVYCGTRKTSHRILTELLQLCAVSVAYGDGFRTAFTIYRINETGRALADDPMLEISLRNAIANRKPFQVKGGKVVELAQPRKGK